MAEDAPGQAERRRRAEGRGRWAEVLCVLALWGRGYRVLGRRVQTPVGELDIVARRGGVLAFVEVKARASRAAAAESVTPRQRRRILRAAAAFLARRPRLAGCAVRFDVMLVAPWRLPLHLKDAFRPEV
ncbi:MAG: YraN family protein [Proteobacteria bacterium]|nr:YraN family protein [Pseudomonadota bacterium]